MDQKAKERIAIAKDALAWIKAGALTPIKGSYIIAEKKVLYEDRGKQLRDIVLGPCKVCARGCLFIAKAVRYDNVLASQLQQAAYNDGPLSEHFDADQLNLIEYVYEGWDTQFIYSDDINWMTKYPSNTIRLIAILKNIIKNKGTFKP